MNTIPREVRYLGGLECFIYKGGSYIPSNYSLECKLNQSLPTVSSKYEQLLIDNNIAYNKLEDGECEIYDKNCYEYEDLTLPVYVHHAIKKAFIYTGKQHTEQVLTNESIFAALEVEQKVKDLIFDATVKEVAEKVKSILGKNPIVFLPTNSPIAQDLMKYRSTLQNRNGYFISKRYTKEGFGSSFGYVILDIKKAEKLSVLDMDVPQHLAGFVIGLGGRNLNELVNRINALKSVNIKHINVHEIAS